MDRNKKAEDLFDKSLDYMINKVQSKELERGELKTILEFLDKQGINCIGSKNKKVTSMLDRLPARVSAEKYMEAN